MKRLLTILTLLVTATAYGQVGVTETPPFTPVETLDVDGTLRASGNIYVGTTSGTNNNIYLSYRMYDWDNTGYYVDPGGVNRMNEIMFDNGSASDVSVHFDGDSNTGLYQPADGEIGVSINGTDAIRVNTSRNVGIGVIPTEKLDVNGDTRVRNLSGTGQRVVLASPTGVLQVNPNIGISPIDDCSYTGPYNLPVYVYYGSWGSENSWELRTGTSWGSGTIINGGTGTNYTVQYNSSVTLNYGTTYYFEARDSYGDGWNDGGYFSLGSPISTGNINPTGFGVLYEFSISICTETPTIQKIIRGSIQSDGSYAGGGGFSLVASGSGRYLITFTTPFSDRPSATVTQVYSDFDSNAWGGNTLDNAIITHLDQNKMQVVTGDGGGTGTDRDFSFIIVGSE